MESEIKLLILPGDVGLLRRHPLIARHACAGPTVQRLTSTYFDTSDLYFRQRGAALRVRRVARRWVQALKGGGNATAGLHRRDEWEGRVRGPAPDLAALRELVGPDSMWSAALADAGLAARLGVMFTTDFRRTTWLLRLDPETLIELALDQGAVVHDDARIVLSEIELELKTGDPGSLFDVALALQASVPLRVSSVTKSQRGFMLRAPAPPEVVKALPLALPGTADVGAALQAIVGNCLAQIEGNEAGVILSSEVESVHQMRVGLRRLRVAVRIFTPVVPAPAALNVELRWLAAELGAARDWEVLADSVLAEIGVTAPDAPGLALLRAAALSKAAERRTQAAQAVRAIRYSRVLLELGRWAHAAPREPIAESSATLAARIMERWHRKLVRQGAELARADSVARHRLRIAARRVRYATEFFASFHPPEETRSYVAALIRLQDVLGRLNDATVAARLLPQLVRENADLAIGAAFVGGYLAMESQQGIRKFDKCWKSFQRIKRPR